MNARTDLSDVLAPVAKAKGLPNAHYTSAEVFEEEKQALLFANWAGIGFAKDVPEPGDAKPITFLGMPLLLLRDRAGEVRVFQNTCRHRGVILVEEPRKIEGAIRCAYHSWCYALTGELRSTPHVGGPGQNLHEDIKRDELGLTPIRHYVWQDVVFVNISGTAPEFEEANAELLERWRDFAQPMAHGGAESSFKLEVKCNWKLAVENYSESYHLPWVHPGLNSYSRLEDHYHIEEAGHFSGQGTRVYRQMVGKDSGGKFPDFKGLPSKWEAGAEYITLFPNVMFGVHRDHCFAILLEPQSFDATIEHVEIYYTPEGAKDPNLVEMRRENAKLWHGVFVEDIFVVEGMQRGRHGIKFDGGKFSPVMDSPTHVFHHWAASHLDAHRKARP
ncbi:aromatic ring-hydroxylating dioxygenase subunit alpha [Alphaproteobacteria bacterium KMM 3653]|uniref:Aromatic ring-hydroxylating dioxygenase subunit alpha n=1 Tax=Harenicola maris TaxID=2841044 RepID=A0AAP2CNU9_9RHOB|nr:aromatic ring-hydroxylating dioxygenase subunit alpha [Harenicola maris]